ncbi:hypothetical protein NIES4101_30100 [Calothrix sp. NIES-4101]|nr:hypothetical protein NIES4101_30100 [Calothrix sp. NIES-4101]
MNRVREIFAVLTIRLWWHLKGYGTILGMMLLLLASMVFLYVNSLNRKLRQSPVENRLSVSK